ncbi:uncharacterized protein MONOS_15040 [Monocercomonoides exilis]|uniref:uncharacterized protein n=1 Tax=Monocercomonoides exilis TaxID=2049356 RepID=UPI003559671C|nr:hypothetical protein MONOS_15040 [Monocercomonoides exilis]|eukprot:MONOS_15040.1-p1 / transcript=MONOS_15040.1 / gene=MONOS_15040 / organism=Monocercomonoides_exilis_PA203 / gene_product=unspecified product / transcript_product=unspecified product / location=Mono_scaffold01132:4100-4390(-) / protein_length=97 / sequence_SO=supercontig / SO=protein_coding / is_pseudo=false
MLGLDPILKGVVVKVESEVSALGEANSGGGGGGGSDGTRSMISEKLEKKCVGANRSGKGSWGGGGRADATVQQKMNKIEKETKKLMAQLKVKEQTI